MKNFLGCLSILFVAVLFTSNAAAQSLDAIARDEIAKAEADFNTMVAEKGIAQAFYFFADDDATIKRGKDSLITGRENIRNYYSDPDFKKATVTWSPDFISVSASGDLGYT